MHILLNLNYPVANSTPVAKCISFLIPMHVFYELSISHTCFHERFMVVGNRLRAKCRFPKQVFLSSALSICNKGPVNANIVNESLMSFR